MPDPTRSGDAIAGVGLACAGGVVEGAFYEIGALCALEEAVDGLDLNRLSTYVGVSSGAIIADFSYTLTDTDGDFDTATQPIRSPGKRILDGVPM